MDAAEFGEFGKSFVACGVNLIGGCCGTTPEHIVALKRNIQDEKPVLPLRKSIAALTSPRKTVFLDREKPLLIICERINPTGKKALKEALREEFKDGRLSLIRRMAKEQEREGADLLDVNVGVPGIDEARAMTDVVDLLAAATELPLVIDSPNAETIEAALRRYPGRALLNSISGEEEKLARLLPVAAKYGAMFILLPLAEGEIPETAMRRKEIIKGVFEKARAHGFTKDDIVVDGLVMTIAANPRGAAETLKTVEWCSGVFGVRTLFGLSNVSFGMPERLWINAAFLAMAMDKGLTLAIANPGHAELMNIKMASDVLMQRDADAGAYIARFAGTKQGAENEKRSAAASPSDELYRAVLEGNREDIEKLIGAAMASGIKAFSLVPEIMTPAITEVGEKYDRREYFLPQLIASAEAMKKGIDYLEPYLKEDGDSTVSKGTVLLATVEGDIHDIGKNIVALMIRNHGFQVIDLGKDVPSGKIVEAARAHPGVVVGLSALMTTTMARMKEVMKLAGQEGLACQFLLGGAVVTEAYARSLGAAYARDGVEAVRRLNEIFKIT
jgi:5-methyltetrahydrofolate--homocysteine methyltransferase